MVTYSMKQLMGLCADYALDAQIQKILFSLDLWVPKAARELHIDNVAQQKHSSGMFAGLNRARSPMRNDGAVNHSHGSNRLRRTLASRSMSAEVFHSSVDTSSVWKTEPRDSTKGTASSTAGLNKKPSTGEISFDENSAASHGQMKLLPILEGGETEDQQNRKETSMKTTTISWTPMEMNLSNSEASTRPMSIDALFELSVRADSALKTALCENAPVSSTSTAGPKTSSATDRITLRKSVSVMNQKQKVGSGRSLVRAKSDMAGSDASRKRALSHIARASERYFSDEAKVIAEIEELELEYLFNYIRHLKTFPKYAEMTEDEILQQVESDPHTLRQRTKEILKGKMSESYAAYIAKYPIKKQRRREHPTSPNKYRKCSRRCFDGQLRTWRRNLHQFDPENEENQKSEQLEEIPEPILTTTADDQV